MNSKKNINLYCEFLSDEWKGIQRYTHQIESSIHQWSKRYEAQIIRPPESWKSLSTFVGRRIVYPLRASAMAHKRGINHIVDQSYSHLIYGLEASETVITCHDLEFLNRSNLTNTWLRRILLNALSEAAAIITPTEATRRDLLKLRPNLEHKTFKVYNSIGPEFIPPRVADRIHIREKFGWRDKRVLLHVGNANMPRKNFVFVLDLLKELVKDDPRYHLVQVGSKLSEDVKGKIKNEGLSTQVQNFQHLDQAALVEVYQASDLLLMPSTYEGFGYPVLEALACGTQALATPLSALNEIAAGFANFRELQIPLWKSEIKDMNNRVEQGKIENLQSKFSAQVQLMGHEKVYDWIVTGNSQFVNPLKTTA